MQQPGRGGMWLGETPLCRYQKDTDEKHAVPRLLFFSLGMLYVVLRQYDILCCPNTVCWQILCCCNTVVCVETLLQAGCCIFKKGG